MDLPTRFFHVRGACSAYLTDISAHPCKPKSSACRYPSAGWMPPSLDWIATSLCTSWLGWLGLLVRLVLPSPPRTVPTLAPMTSPLQCQRRFQWLSLVAALWE